MKLKALAVAILSLFAAFATPARAIECDQLAGPPSGMGLCIPRYGTDFDQWSQAISTAFAVINSSAIIQGSTNTANVMGDLFVRRIGGISTGTAGVRISSAIFQDAGYYATFGSSVNVTGGGGVTVTYGVKAATAAFGSGATVSTFTSSGGLTLDSAAALSIGAGKLADGVIHGQDIAASTIPLSALNQSGAALNEVVKWNGSAWAPGADSSGTRSSTFTVMCNGDFAPAATTQATEEALSGSTITMTTSAGTWVRVCWSGSININSAEGFLDLIVDGARPSFTGSNGTWKLGSFASSIDLPTGGCVNVSGLSAASHSFSLMGWRGGNPLTIRRSNPCLHFSAEEK